LGKAYTYLRMALVVYGVEPSQPVRSVLWACALMKLPITFKRVMPGSRKEGGTRSPDFLKLNPFGQVPVIDDNGFVLSESAAILTYLAEKHSWPLLPKDPRVRAKISSYMHWHHRNTREITLKVFAPVVRKDLGLPADAAGAEKIFKQFDTAVLGRGDKFIVGDQVTIADLLAYEEIVQCLPEYCNLIDFKPYANIQRWMAEMRKLPHHDELHNNWLLKLKPMFDKAKL